MFTFSLTEFILQNRQGAVLQQGWYYMRGRGATWSTKPIEQKRSF